MDDVVLLQGCLETCTWVQMSLVQRLCSARSVDLKTRRGRYRCWRPARWAMTPTKLIKREARGDDAASTKVLRTIDIARHVTSATVVPFGKFGAPHVLHVATAKDDEYLAFDTAKAARDWHEQLQAVIEHRRKLNNYRVD